MLSDFQTEINSEKVKERFRTDKKYFTRTRCFTFAGLVMMRLNLMNKTLNVELEQIKSIIKGFFSDSTPSKQAFSKAISHIKWEGFQYFNDFFVKLFYQTSDYQIFADKYILIGGDGTDIQLPNEEKLKEHFGVYTNGQMPDQCTSKSVKLYDVLNHVTITSVLAPYKKENSKGVSEKALFDQQVKRLPKLIEVSNASLLITGDKYYPCFRYFFTLPRIGINFLFRCRENFCLETIAFAKSGKKDGIIEIDMNRSNRKYQKSVKTKSVFEADDDSIVNVPDIIRVRCVRIERGNKAPMFLLTNLPKAELLYEQIGEAYNMRWGTETSFDLDKNTLEVENFSSKTPNGVLQEFHAKTLTANISELLVCQAQKELDTEQKEKNC